MKQKIVEGRVVIDARIGTSWTFLRIALRVRQPIVGRVETEPAKTPVKRQNPEGWGGGVSHRFLVAAHGLPMGLP